MQLLKLSSRYLTTLLVFACRSATEKAHVADSLMDNNKSVTSHRLKQQFDRPSLAGNIFLFAPELDKNNCSAKGPCDCCSYNILFTTDSTFVLIDYCEANFSYNKGNYTFDGSLLTLNVDRLMVNKNYNWEKETDTTGKVTKEYFYKTENIKPTTTVLKRQDCNGTIIFKGVRDFGAVDKERAFEQELKALKDEGIWTRLELQ